MDRNVYTLTFLDAGNEPHTMTSYGWKMVEVDLRSARGIGWELISVVRLHVTQ